MLIHLRHIIMLNCQNLFKGLESSKIIKVIKVYKAISDSLGNHKILNYIGVSFILNCLICINYYINFGWVLYTCIREENKIVPKNKRFILIVCIVKVVYNNLHMIKFVKNKYMYKNIQIHVPNFFILSK